MSNIDCTPEEKIHDLLVELKKNNQEFYEPTKRILGYLYKTVKCDFFDQKIILEERKDKEKEDFTRKVFAASNNLYKTYINGEDNILDSFIKLIHDDPKYFNCFFKEVEPFLEMSEEHLYSDYEICNYVFNLYVILKSYMVSENDFTFFEDTLKSYAHFFISSKMNIDRGYVSSYYGIEDQDFVSKKDLIDELIELRKYSNNTFVDDLLKNILDNINLNYNEYTKRRYKEAITCAKELYSFINDNENEYNEETVKELEDRIKTMIEEANSSRSSSYRDTFLNYFSKVILVGDRYNFLKTTLETVEPSVKYQKDILSQIEKLDYQFFEFLNKEVSEENDSFITCMKIVFDSDTYFELLSKMSYISKASHIYKEDPKFALQLINTLNDDKHKEVINGVKMAWPKNNSLNKVNKPVTILDRTIALHRTLEYAPSESFYREKAGSSYYSTSIRELVETAVSQFATNRNAELERIKKEQEAALAQAQVEEPPKKAKGLGSIFGKKNNN